MNPLHLTARNYRGFAELDIALADGCTAIVGPNGAGKSSIVNAIDYALFGGRLADHLTDTLIDGLLELELSFEHHGELYRVRRTFNSAGRGKSTLDFELANGWHDDEEPGPMDESPEWHPLSRESLKETQALIEETIGFTRDTWRASSFLAQGDGAAFTQADPRDRKRILSEAVLGRAPIWPRLLEAVRADKKQTAENIAIWLARTEEARVQLERLPEVARQAEDLAVALERARLTLADAERRRDDADERYRLLEGTAAARRTAQAELESARTRFETLERVQQAGDEATTALAELLPQLEELERLASEAEQVRARNLARVGAAERARQVRETRARLTAEKESLSAMAVEYRGRADELVTAGDAEQRRCDACGQVMGAEARGERVVHYRDEAADLDRQVNELERELAELPFDGVVEDPEPLTTELASAAGELGAGRERQAILLGKIEAASEARDGFALAREAVEVAERAAASLPEVDAALFEEVQQAGLQARADAAETREQVENLVGRHAGAIAERVRLAELEADTAAIREELATATRTQDELAILERAYGPNGVPATIIENAAIPAIEAEADRVLEALGGVATGVQLRTQRELKSGEGLADTLDVVVLTADGERAYESLSGGERSRVNVALRIGLARLLAGRRGAESDLLVLDEVEFLDEDGQSRLADVLRGLEGEFRKLVLVSHVPGLRDVFEQVVEVSKIDGESQLLA